MGLFDHIKGLFGKDDRLQGLGTPQPLSAPDVGDARQFMDGSEQLAEGVSAFSDERSESDIEYQRIKEKFEIRLGNQRVEDNWWSLIESTDSSRLQSREYWDRGQVVPDRHSPDAKAYKDNTLQFAARIQEEFINPHFKDAAAIAENLKSNFGPLMPNASIQDGLLFDGHLSRYVDVTLGAQHSLEVGLFTNEHPVLATAQIMKAEQAGKNTDFSMRVTANAPLGHRGRQFQNLLTSLNGSIFQYAGSSQSDKVTNHFKFMAADLTMMDNGKRVLTDDRTGVIAIGSVNATAAAMGYPRQGINRFPPRGSNVESMVVLNRRSFVSEVRDSEGKVVSRTTDRGKFQEIKQQMVNAADWARNHAGKQFDEDVNFLKSLVKTTPEQKIEDIQASIRFGQSTQKVASLYSHLSRNRQAYRDAFVNPGEAQTVSSRILSGLGLTLAHLDLIRGNAGAWGGAGKTLKEATIFTYNIDQHFLVEIANAVNKGAKVNLVLGSRYELSENIDRKIDAGISNRIHQLRGMIDADKQDSFKIIENHAELVHAKVSMFKMDNDEVHQITGSMNLDVDQLLAYYHSAGKEDYHGYVKNIGFYAAPSDYAKMDADERLVSNLVQQMSLIQRTSVRMQGFADGTQGRVKGLLNKYGIQRTDAVTFFYNEAEQLSSIRFKADSIVNVNGKRVNLGSLGVFTALQPSEAAVRSGFGLKGQIFVPEVTKFISSAMAIRQPGDSGTVGAAQQFDPLEIMVATISAANKIAQDTINDIVEVLGADALENPAVRGAVLQDINKQVRDILKNMTGYQDGTPANQGKARSRLLYTLSKDGEGDLLDLTAMTRMDVFDLEKALAGDPQGAKLPTNKIFFMSGNTSKPGKYGKENPALVYGIDALDEVAEFYMREDGDSAQIFSLMPLSKISQIAQRTKTLVSARNYAVFNKQMKLAGFEDIDSALLMSKLGADEAVHDTLFARSRFASGSGEAMTGVRFKAIGLTGLTGDNAYLIADKFRGGYFANTSAMRTIKIAFEHAASGDVGRPLLEFLEGEAAKGEQSGIASLEDGRYLIKRSAIERLGNRMPVAMHNKIINNLKHLEEMQLVSEDGSVDAIMLDLKPGRGISLDRTSGTWNMSLSTVVFKQASSQWRSMISGKFPGLMIQEQSPAVQELKEINQAIYGEINGFASNIDSINAIVSTETIKTGNAFIQTGIEMLEKGFFQSQIDYLKSKRTTLSSYRTTVGGMASLLNAGEERTLLESLFEGGNTAPVNFDKLRDLLNKTSAYLNESPDNLISLKGTPQHATAAMLAFAVHAAYSYEKLLEKDQAHLQARAPGGSLRGLRHRLATLFTPNRIAEQRAELGNGPNVPAMGPQVLAASMYLSWVGSMSSLAQPVSTREGVNFLNFHRGGYTDPFYTMIANSEATNKKQRALKELLLATAFSAFLDPKSANSRIVFAGTFNPMAYYTSLGSRDPFVHITQQIEKAKSLAQNPEADIRELYAIEKSVSQEIDSAQKYIKQKQAESGDLDSRVVSRGIGGVISSETVQVNNAYEKAGLGEQIVVIPQYRFGGDHKIRGIEGVQLVKFMRPETLRAAGAFEDYSDPVLSLQVKLMRLLRFGGSIHSKAVNKIALTTQEKQIYESILQVAGALRLAQEQMVASGLQRYMGGRFMLAGRNVIAGTAAEIDPGTMVLGSQVWEDIATQTVDTFYKKINAAASKQKGVQAADTEQVDFNQLRLNQVKALKDKLVQQVRQDRGDVLGDAYAAKAAVALQTLEIAIAGGEGEGSLSALTLKQEQLQSEVRTLIEQSGFGAVKSVAEFRRTAGFEIRRLLKSHFQQAAEGMAEAAQNRRGAAALKNSLTAVQDLLDAEQQNKLTELDARISGAYDRFYKEAPSKQDYVERDQAYEQRITELRDRNADLKDEVKALNRKMPAQVRGELIKIAGSGADVKDYLITELRKHQKGNALYVHHSLTEQGIASLPESLKLVQQRDALQTEINQNIASMGQERSQRNAELRQVVQAGVKDSEQSDQEIQGLFKEKNRVVNSLFHEVVGKLTTQINEATLAGNTEHANALLARITSNAHMHYAYLQQQIGNQVAAFFKGNRLVSREDGSIDLEHLQANLTGDSAEGRRVLQLAGQLNQLKQNLDEQAIGKKQIKQAQRQINYRDAFEQALRTLALDPLARRSIGLFGMMQRSGAPQGNHALVTGELLTDTEFNEGDRRILLDAGFNRTGVLFNIGAMGVFLGDNDGDAALIAALQRNVELRLNSLGLDGENLTKEEQNELEGVRRQRLITQQEIHFMMTKEYTAFGHLFDEAKLYGMGSRDAIASASLVDGSYTEASQQKAAWAYRELHAQVVATVGHTELDPLTELAGLDAQTREQRAGELVGRLYAGKGDALTFNGIALSEEQAKTAWLGYAGRLSDAYTLGMSASKFTRDQVGMHQELIGFMNKKRDSYATYGDAFDAFFAEGGAGETLGRKMYAKNEGMLTDIFMGGQSEGDAYAPVSLKAFQTLMSMTLFAATSVMSSVYEAVDIARVVADTNRTASIADIASGESFAELKSSYLELQAGQGDQLAYERANAIHNRQLGALLTLQQIARDAIKPKKSGIELINEIEKRLKNSPFVKGSDMAMDAELNPHMQGLENVVRIALDKDFRGNSLNASDVPDLSNETQRNAFVEQLITTLDFHHGENAAIAESLLNASAGSKDDRHRQQAELVADLFQKVATIGQQKRAVGLALSRMDTSSPDAMAETFAKMYEGSAFRLTSNAQKAEILTRELFSLQSRAKLNDHGRFEGLLRQIFSYDLYFGGVKADVATTKANFQKMALLQTGNIEFAERFGEIYEGYRQTNEQTSDAPGANRNFYEEYFQKAFVGDFFADFQTNYKQKFGTVLEDTVQSILDFTPDGSSEAGKSIKKLQDRLQKGLADIQSRPDGRVSEVAVASLISRIDQEGNRDEKAAYLGIDEIGSELGLSEDKIASFKAAQNMALAQSLINNTRASDLFQQGYGLVDESQAHGQPSATAQKLIHTGTNVLGFAAISTAAALMTQTSGAEAAEDEQSSGALIGQSVATAAAMAHPASLASVLTGNPNSSAGQKLESLGLMGVGVAAGAFAGNMVNEHYHNKLIQTITEGSIESEEHLLQQVGRNSQKANIYGSAVSAIVGGAAPLLLEAMAQAIGLKKEFNPIPQAMMDLVGIDLESLGDVMDDFIEESFNLNPDTGSVDSQGRIAVFDAAGNFVDQVSYVHNWASVDSEVESGDPTSQIAEDALESVITSYHYDSNLHPL